MRGRTAKDYRKSIATLLEDAEAAAKNALAQTQESETQKMSESEMQNYLRGLDVMISEDTMIALRAEFLRYSSIFDTQQTQETIKMAVAEVVKPLVEAWLNRHMSQVTREVITDALGKMAQIRHHE